MTNAFQPAVIAPTFNNVRTLDRVLRGIDESGLPVIVVDDGCNDGSFAILDAWRKGGRWRVVVHHPRNQGKAAALRSGFEAARQMGFTHAITIDTDGQLDPAEINHLTEIARESPDALVLGRRASHAENYPAASRLGRWASNVLLRWESGAVVSDSQCGFRVYPLSLTHELSVFARRYGFETEILTRAVWAGISIREYPVSCTYTMPEGRVSHFRPWRDSLLCGAMHIRLLTRSMTPVPMKKRFQGPSCSSHAGPCGPGSGSTGPGVGMIWQRFLRSFNPAELWRGIRKNAAERTGFSQGLAVGVFIANTPLYGLHSLLSLFAARRLRLNPMPVLLGSHLSAPAFAPMLIAAAITIGHLLLHGTLPTIRHFAPSVVGYAALARSVILEWAVGGVVLGTVLAIAAYAISGLLLRCVPLSRQADSAADPDAPAPGRAPAIAESAA